MEPGLRAGGGGNGWLSRKPSLALLLLYTALILHGTLWPYNFNLGGEFVSQRVQVISWIPKVTDANRGGVGR